MRCWRHYSGWRDCARSLADGRRLPRGRPPRPQPRQQPRAKCECLASSAPRAPTAAFHAASRPLPPGWNSLWIPIEPCPAWDTRRARYRSEPHQLAENLWLSFHKGKVVVPGDIALVIRVQQLEELVSGVFSYAGRESGTAIGHTHRAEGREHRAHNGAKLPAIELTVTIEVIRIEREFDLGNRETEAEAEEESMSASMVAEG
eukprot:scaffold289999_cov35-Tisochrysis_lutea.AAC.2